jgi:hypothetical protein
MAVIGLSSFRYLPVRGSRFSGLQHRHSGQSGFTSYLQSSNPQDSSNLQSSNPHAFPQENL